MKKVMNLQKKTTWNFYRFQKNQSQIYWEHSQQYKLAF